MIFVNCPLLLNDRSSLTKKARLNVPVLQQPRTSLSARAEWVRPKLKLSFVRALGRAKLLLVQVEQPRLRCSRTIFVKPEVAAIYEAGH